MAEQDKERDTPRDTAPDPADVPGTREFKVTQPERDLQPEKVEPMQTERADPMHGEKFVRTDPSPPKPGDRQAAEDVPGTREFKMRHPEQDLTPGKLTPENRNRPDAMHEAAMRGANRPAAGGDKRAAQSETDDERRRRLAEEQRQREEAEAREKAAGGYANRQMRTDTSAPGGAAGASTTRRPTR